MPNHFKNFSLPAIEEKVLKFWQDNKIFEKSLEKNKKKKKFIFYEGPPTANGRPGLHHVLSRSFKDIVLRYKTMRGFFVPRQAGWDTHGLPVELEVEKQLGLNSKKDIEKYGISLFNQKCRESVWLYKEEWEKLTERMGFWLDLKHPYITYENFYIEKIWAIIKEIFQKKLLVQGYKVVPWCPRCGTALSSHELALGYKTVIEPAVYLKFKLKNYQKTYLLSWTTTPWTLAGNVALAINPKFIYSQVKVGEENYILAKERLKILEGDYKVIKEFRGEELIGLSYEPLFKVEKLKSKNSYKIYPADFVNLEEGTGIVHTAVMYGEEDYELGKKFNLPQYHTVNEQGIFTKEIPELVGLYVKSPETEKKIFDYLKNKNLLFKIENYSHEYPFCWRCQTPLLYYARNSWFILMSKLRKKLLQENQKINWLPAHLKNGRFGQWLKEVKDWNISRERYWGTPLPIWQCSQCHFKKVIGSLEELDQELPKANNRYLLLRHGLAESNIKEIISFVPEKGKKYHLTLKGRVEIEKLAKKLKKEKIDFIFSSDITRAKETAQILEKELKVKVIYDQRLKEINLGIFQGTKSYEYHHYFSSDLEKFTKPIPKGETLLDVTKRVFSFIRELEQKYKNKTFIIISHEYPLWMIEMLMRGWSIERAVFEKEKRGEDFIAPGELREVFWLNGPRNEFGIVDLHRPYIDQIFLKCPRCLGKMERVKEVIDVWFDSGAMPFASLPAGYPADYIVEAVDQTRGWFYTLLAIGVLLDKGRPYKNVISLGHVLDKEGQKMSKSKGNVVDPWLMIKKYGIDTVRWYFFTINAPEEAKKFDEADLIKTFRRFILLVYNSFLFFQIYHDQKIKPEIKKLKLKILDRWILTRYYETLQEVTKKLDQYEIVKGAKLIENFVDDLSRWYLRRSRRRFQKPENQKDFETASQVLGYLLFNLSKILAPFIPFFAEFLYQSLEIDKKYKKLSVHLEDWPKPDLAFKKINQKILKEMEKLRKMSSQILAQRNEAGIKLRQPLAKLKIKNKKLFKDKEFYEILKEEINVKTIVFDKNIEKDFELDTELTHELKEEGWLRELIRLIQVLRQDCGLEPKNKIILYLDLPEELNYLAKKYENLLKKETNTKEIEYKRKEIFDGELETKLDEWPIWIGLKKF